MFFPGSTLGNFEPAAARRFLVQAARVAGPGGGLLLGIDRKKEPAVLERAYNDPQGVTAAFNLNLLARLNRELAAGFDPAAWTHRARYNSARGRVEMHLVSTQAQTVHVAGQAFAFAAGETIHTENAYKYGPGDAEALAHPAALVPLHEWTDARAWFAVLWFEARP